MKRLIIFSHHYVNDDIKQRFDFVKKLTSPIDINSLNKLDKDSIKKDGKFEDLNILKAKEPYVYRSNK